jgi:hypothetical protein
MPQDAADRVEDAHMMQFELAAPATQQATPTLAPAPITTTMNNRLHHWTAACHNKINTAGPLSLR